MTQVRCRSRKLTPARDAAISTGSRQVLMRASTGSGCQSRTGRSTDRSRWVAHCSGPPTAGRVSPRAQEVPIPGVPAPSATGWTTSTTTRGPRRPPHSSGEASTSSRFHTWPLTAGQRQDGPLTLEPPRPLPNSPPRTQSSPRTAARPELEATRSRLSAVDRRVVGGVGQPGAPPTVAVPRTHRENRLPR